MKTVTCSQCNEGIDGLLEAPVSLVTISGLQGHKVGEVRPLRVLHTPPQPLDDLGHAASLELVQGSAVQHPDRPAHMLASVSFMPCLWELYISCVVSCLSALFFGRSQIECEPNQQTLQ